MKKFDVKEFEKMCKVNGYAMGYVVNEYVKHHKKPFYTEEDILSITRISSDYERDYHNYKFFYIGPGEFDEENVDYLYN